MKDPTKRWKFSADDLAERKHWDDYISAYEAVLQRCSTNWAPWFIVPADRNGIAMPSSRALSVRRSKHWI